MEELKKDKYRRVKEGQDSRVKSKNKKLVNGDCGFILRGHMNGGKR